MLGFALSLPSYYKLKRRAKPSLSELGQIQTRKSGLRILRKGWCILSKPFHDLGIVGNGLIIAHWYALRFSLSMMRKVFRSGSCRSEVFGIHAVNLDSSGILIGNPLSLSVGVRWTARRTRRHPWIRHRSWGGMLDPLEMTLCRLSRTLLPGQRLGSLISLSTWQGFLFFVDRPFLRGAFYQVKKLRIWMHKPSLWQGCSFPDLL